MSAYFLKHHQQAITVKIIATSTDKIALVKTILIVFLTHLGIAVRYSLIRCMFNFYTNECIHLHGKEQGMFPPCIYF